MITDVDGWCSPEAGEDVDDFLDKFVASRAPLTGSEIARLRAIFRPVVQQAEPQRKAA